MTDEPDNPSESERSGLDHLPSLGNPETRRKFIQKLAGTSATLAISPIAFNIPGLEAVNTVAKTIASPEADSCDLHLQINGKGYEFAVDPRVTLLDALRERLHMTGTKKGCDHGQCGACTVLVNGRRINSCLTLALMHDGDEITTIEGLANGDELHPMQAAFIEQDGFQCGYCTPGQICSAVALLAENHANSDDEIREWMSGNICRCGAYPNILAAIKKAKGKT